jgi:hypothetical protein
MTESTKPESWNAKMLLSGKPLITKEQLEQLVFNAPKSLDKMERHDPVPVMKIFLPHFRWLLCWIYPDNLDYVRVIARMAGPNGSVEVGDELLSSIVNARLGRVTPERDLYITLNKPMSHYICIRTRGASRGIERNALQ